MLCPNAGSLRNMYLVADAETWLILLIPALAPRARVNLTRFHGVFSPNSRLREYVVPQKPVEEQENPKSKAYSMTWAQRLKRVFAIDIEKCEKCGGPFESSHRLKTQMLFRRS